MTTVAWGGQVMAADTLVTDCWGLKAHITNKILRGEDFLLGCAGEHGQIMRWWSDTACMLSHDKLLAAGYKPYAIDNDPSFILACEAGVFCSTGGVFIPIYRRFHAIGSGRDYALMAMRLGIAAADAVKFTMEFDNNTGGDVVTRKL